MDNNDDNQGGGNDFKALIPEAYKDKPYLAEVENMEGVFKMLDGAETLIGKRAVPGEDATADQFVEFYKTVGMPETAEEYNPGLEEGKKDELFDSLKPAFHKAGLSVKQAKGLFTEAGPILQQLAGDAAEAKAAQDKEFDELTTRYLGAEQDTKPAQAKEMINKHAPDDLAKSLDQLDNKSLVIMSAVLSQMHDKLYKEDDNLGGDGKTAASSDDVQKNRCMEINTLLQKSDSTMTEEAKDKLRAERKKIYAERNIK